jgi:hypothetical protein
MRAMTDCGDCGQLIGERDAARDAADALVEAIERLLAVDCGEHSNLNCPWEEALAFVEGEIARRDQGVTESCGCVFCDLDLKPEAAFGGAPMHAVAGKAVFMACTRK